MNGKWNVIDSYTLLDHIETLAEEIENNDSSFDALLREKIEKYLSEDMPNKTKILLEAFRN